MLCFLFVCVGHNEPNNVNPVWIRYFENSFGCAYKVFCGPEYSLILCGALMVPYFFGCTNKNPNQIFNVNGLHDINTAKVICTSESIVFAKANQKLLKMSPNDVSHIADIDHLSLLPDIPFIMGLMKNLNENSTPFYLSNETFRSLNL